MPNRSILIGYSLGGSTSLAIAAYYERNNTGIKIDQIHTGGGIYDGLVALIHTDVQKEVSTKPSLKSLWL